MSIRYFKVQISNLFILDLDEDQSIDEVIESVASGMEAQGGVCKREIEELDYNPIVLNQADPLLAFKLRWVDRFKGNYKFMLTAPTGIVLQAVTGEEVTAEEAEEDPA